MNPLKQNMNQDRTEQKSGKIVVVGDGACGKTCLLEVFKKNTFPEDYIPTIIDNFVKDVEVEGEIISLAVWDTAGQEEYDAVRPVSYSETDLVFLCYSIENKDMLYNISDKWMPEIRNYCPLAGTFLIGLKSDLRSGDSSPKDKAKLASMEDGEKMKEKLGAAEFYECSARENYNVKEVFDAAALWLMKKKEKPEGRKKRWFFCFCF